MGYSYKFTDNTIYGAEDINDVINEFATAGVADVYFDGTSYNTSDLNKIAASFATGGIKYADSDSCKAVRYSSDSVKVLTGTAFFDDGSIIKIDADGVILKYTTGVKNYVYLKGNIKAQNRNEVCCTVYEGTGDIVPIAEIEADGTITDKRKFCRGKIGGYQSSYSLTKRITVNYSMSGGGGATQDFTYDLGGYGYSHIIDISKKERCMKGDLGFPTSIGIYDIVNDYAVAVSYRLGETNTSYANPNGMLVYPCRGSMSSDADIWQTVRKVGIKSCKQS
ncbi:MAG: hypothetical protein J1F64_09045 [Oscillospiraceae bacterium]|nr:hypothetical protein [Oscillospiraceae bacterium]